MLDWLGSVRIRRRTATRVELELTPSTRIAGVVIAVVGVRVALWPHPAAHVVGAVAAIVGILLASLARTLVFDREDGLLRVEQTLLGIRRRAAIPLFHLRAVVVAMRRGGLFVAYVERRVGGEIHLDEARKPAPLLALAEAISEVAELRMVYDATMRRGTQAPNGPPGAPPSGDVRA